MSEYEDGEIQDVFGAAISGAAEQLKRGMVTGFVVVVEAVNEDGSMGCWLAASRDATPWQVMGWLKYAMTYEEAAVHNATRSDG